MFEHCTCMHNDKKKTYSWRFLMNLIIINVQLDFIIEQVTLNLLYIWCTIFISINANIFTDDIIIIIVVTAAAAAAYEYSFIAVNKTHDTTKKEKKTNYNSHKPLKCS